MANFVYFNIDNFKLYGYVDIKYTVTKLNTNTKIIVYNKHT